MKKIVFLYFEVFIMINAYAQSSYITSPEATAMGKFIEYPVSNYTGIPTISIPLYEIKLKDFSLPISLGYHAKGILVGDFASNVGLGWNLNAGGMITRAVRSHPDDHNKNHQYLPKDEYDHAVENNRMGLFWSGNADDLINFNGSSTDYDYVYNTLSKNITIEKGVKEELGEGKCDIEPDIFYFNYGEISGQFIFDISNNTQKIHLLSYQDLQIYHTLDNDGRIASFKIIDSDGNSYFFEDVETLHRIDFAFKLFEYKINVDDASSSRCDTRYNSAWYLTKIITNCNQIVTFYYYDDNYILHDSSSASINPNLPPESAEITRTTSMAINNYSSKRISHIETPNESILFKPSTKREDRIEPTYAIGEIDVVAKGSLRKTKGYTFSYSYFNSSKEPIEYDWGNTIAGTSAYFYRDFYSKRLKLDSIIEDGIGSTKFYYDTRLQLPHIFSFRQDNWGFFNDAKENTSLIPTLYIYPKMRGSNRFSIFKLAKTEPQDMNALEGAFTYQKANREVNPSSITTGTLVKIEYPTGGHIIYDYEPNQFWYKGENRYGGGIRIRSIKVYNYSSSKPSLERNYQYTLDDGKSSGKLLNMPIYVDCLSPSVYKNLLINTQSNASLGSSNAVGYTQVTVSDGYGKCIYNYSCPASYGELSDESESGIYKASPVNAVFLGNRNYDLHTEANTSPFPPNPNYDWSRGLLLSEKVYNSSNKIIKEIDYVYDNFYKKRQLKKVYGIKYRSGLVPYNTEKPYKYTDAIIFSKYEQLANVNKVLVSKIERSYSQDSNTPFIKTNQYKYNSIHHMNITENISHIGNGNIIVDKFLYSPDVTGGPAEQGEGIAALTGKGITKLIEKTKFLEKDKVQKLIEAELTTYDDMLEIVRPVKKYILETDTQPTDFKPAYNDMGILKKDIRYRENQKYNNYDSYGNPIYLTKNEVTHTIYLWSYSGQYPIAEIKNANYTDVSKAIDIEALSQKAQPTEADYQAIRALETSLKSTLITTYTYKPLVGMTSMTDARGVTTTYEYDSFGRLAKVKDANGKVINTYDYHYQNQ